MTAVPATPAPKQPPSVAPNAPERPLQIATPKDGNSTVRTLAF